MFSAELGKMSLKGNKTGNLSSYPSQGSTMSLQWK